MNLSGYRKESGVFIALVLIVKIIFLVIFSSGYSENLFYPFLKSISSENLNPWDYYVRNKLSLDAFPYHGLMLYVLYPFALLGKLLGIGSFILKVPLLLADLLIFYFLILMFKSKVREIVTFYFANPVVIYATYVHSQLDIIPTALMFVCVFYLTIEQYNKSAIIFGLALATKIHVVMALPLLLIFLIKKHGFMQCLRFVGISLTLLIVLDLPFCLSEGFISMVLNNPKQDALLSSFYNIADLKLILPIAAISSVYLHFLNRERVNQDLLFFYFGFLFTVVLIFIKPEPAWYLWMVPFTSIYFIRSNSKNVDSFLYVFFTICYLLFFVLLNQSEYQDILFIGQYVDLKINNALFKNIGFTLLEVSLLALMYTFYSYGLKSNALYKRNGNLAIGIGGDSGVGKSRLLDSISQLFGDKLLKIEGDGEHKWARGDKNWAKFTHLDPKANFIHKQAEAISDLKNNQIIFRSEYEHSTGTFTSPKKVVPREFLVIAGLHPFYLPKMRKTIDLKIYLDTDEKLRRHWKITRDTQKRGYTLKSIQEQMDSRLEDAIKYIHPQKNFADLILRYYPINELIEGELNQEVTIGLKITLDANVHLESLLTKLKGDYTWDYNTDLNTQFLDIRCIDDLEYENVAFELIPNLTDIISPKAIWENGVDGLVQLITMKIISEQLKVKN